ncbi:MAG: hypothetical protein ABIR84_12765 [Candidatus Nitrotoga sp.]
MRTNGVDFSLAINVINQLPCLRAKGLYVKEILRNLQIDCRKYVHVHSIDNPGFRE